MPLVAKKGKEVTHHFAHAADSSCQGAAETALHRLAKEIVQKELRLSLPAVTAKYLERTGEMHPAKEVVFTRAYSEARNLGEVVPDVLLECGDRTLLVEIWVTHACDEAKRLELRQKGIATVEINLSKFPRNATREEVAKAVLTEAERHWVYHPKIEIAITEMRAADSAAKKLVETAFNETLDRMEAIYEAGLKQLAAQRPSKLDPKIEIVRAGYGSHVGISVDGSGCFTVAPVIWQRRILGEVFTPSNNSEYPTSYVKEILTWFKKEKLIRNDFNYVAPDIEDALIARAIGFLSPYKSIEKYLEVLRQNGVGHLEIP
jgi:hypothetical protein